MASISINERFNLQFVTRKDEHEKTLSALIAIGFNPVCKNVTKDYPGGDYPFSETRKEVVFDIHNVDVVEVVLIKQVLKRI